MVPEDKTIYFNYGRREMLKLIVKFVAGVLAAYSGLGFLNPTPAMLNAADEITATEPFRWARVKFTPKVIRNDPWNAYPEVDIALLEYIKKNTSINVSPTWNWADLKNLNEMTKYPILFITANGEFDPPAADLENLKEYLLRGGFIYADDCVDDFRGDGFFRSFKATIERFFGAKMEKLPNDHELYHCFYDLPDGAPNPHRKCVKHGGWGFYLKGRLVVYLTSGDIHCGWKSRLLRKAGRKPWMSEKDEAASFNLGVNILIYALSH